MVAGIIGFAIGAIFGVAMICCFVVASETDAQMEKGLKGASFINAVMSVGQDSPLDMLMYYDARPCGMNGMFDTDTLAPLKGYYSIKSFSDLAELGTHVKTEQAEDVYSVAATDGRNAAVLLTHFNDDDSTPADTLKLEVKNFPISSALRAEYYLLDGEHDMKLVLEEIFTASDFAAYLELPLFTSYLIKFTEVNCIFLLITAMRQYAIHCLK